MMGKVSIIGKPFVKIFIFIFSRLWLDDKAHGEGRMIYENGDVYEGFWFMGQRSGYGILTR